MEGFQSIGFHREGSHDIRNKVRVELLRGNWMALVVAMVSSFFISTTYLGSGQF